MADEVVIKFTRDSRDGEAEDKIFEGKELRVSRASADRWIRRGAAVEVDPKAEAEAKKKAEADAKAKAEAAAKKK